MPVSFFPVTDASFIVIFLIYISGRVLFFTVPKSPTVSRLSPTTFNPEIVCPLPSKPPVKGNSSVPIGSQSLDNTISFSNL